jgi:hypothetical protein
VPPVLLALALLLGLLALVPTRRLARLGWSAGSLGAYFLALWLLALVAAVAGGPARLLVPLLLIAWVAPFVTWRDSLDRFRGRMHEGDERPIRNVTPPDERDRAS